MDLTVADARLLLENSITGYEHTLAAQQQVIDDAKQRMVDAAAQVEERTAALLALSQIEDEPIDLGLVRRLYWESPVPVKLLATVLGLKHAGEVFEKVGPYNVEKECIGGCGVPIRVKLTNRTAAGSSRRHVWRCDDCRRKADEQRAVTWERSTAARQEWVDEELVALRAAVAAGQEPTAVYIEYPGVQGTWRLDDAQIVGGTIRG